MRINKLRFISVAETLSRPVSDADRRVILGIRHEHGELNR